MSRLDTTLFALTLDDDWVRVAGDMPGRYVFESPLRDTSLTISLEEMSTPADQLDEVARKLADHRIESHLSAAQAHGWLFDMVDPVIVAQDWGRMVAYHGGLRAGGAFSFVGLVLPAGVVSLFAESEAASADSLDAILGEVAAGMEI